MIIQSILVFAFFILAVGFLVKKFFWKPKEIKVDQKSSDACGGSDCGCH